MACKKPAVSIETAQTRRESHQKTDKNNMYKKVLEVLENDELTAREIAEKLYNNREIAYPARAVIQPRITELVENGLVKVTGKKYDKVTKRKVAQYRKVG